MTTSNAPQLVTTWFGVFVVESGQVRQAHLFPKDAQALAVRRRARREGRLVPEEEELLTKVAPSSVVTRDRRFVVHGVAFGGPELPSLDPTKFGFDPEQERTLVLEEGAETLRAAWDPSVHLEEAVRTVSDLDRVSNLLAERLTSWAGRDTLTVEGEFVDRPQAIAEAIVSGHWVPATELPGVDPALVEARALLARLYLETLKAREQLDAAVQRALPGRAPNLDRLLGAEVAARLISQAGGLDRLARLPSSTVQVLGAERAFFEHLRGHAPPPRHGILFLHPSIQSAPRWQRGKLARALAGKAVIAARLDLAGAAVEPSLAEAYGRRAEAIRAGGPRRTRRGRRDSGSPLHGATEDR